MVAMVPPLRDPTRHKTARKTKSGRFGRDDGIRKAEPQERSQECLCHMGLWSGEWVSKLGRVTHRIVD